MTLDELTDIDGVVLSPSGFADVDALWVNGKEIAHLDDADTVDIRVGRKHISARKLPARSKGSEWCEVPTSDVALVRELIELAASQHRAAQPKPPPTGADLERRRRFH